MEDARALYPAKAAAGPCTRLARCGRSRFPDAHLLSGLLRGKSAALVGRVPTRSGHTLVMVTEGGL
jgi:hypothetical protein